MITSPDPPTGDHAEAPTTQRHIGRLNDIWHPHVRHHPWTPRGFVLAAAAIALMLVILIIVLTFAFSSGGL